MNSITNQSYLFLIFIINGVLIGIVFDIFRILRKSFNTPNYLTYIEDTLFWIISALIVMYSLFIFNNGNFRAYIFIGILLGVAIYMLFFSKVIIKISTKTIEVLKKVFLFILKIFSYPINFIYKVLKITLIAPIIHIFTKIKKKIHKNKEILQK